MPRLELPTGVRLHHVLGGGGDGLPVVFVNGLTMDTTAWKLVERRLALSRPTVRYDARGQGESEAPPGPYPPETHADDLLALLDALSIERAHLVGLSNGGLVAMLVAGRAPERVAGLAALDSFARVDPLLRTILDGWGAALAKGGPGLRFDVATPWVWGHAFLAEHLEEVLAFRGRAEAADPAAVRGLIEGLRGFRGDARDGLARHAGPLLLMTGRDDVLTPPRYALEIAERAPAARVVLLEGAGHAAPIERPDAVAAVLEGFLAAADPEEVRGGA